MTTEEQLAEIIKLLVEISAKLDTANQQLQNIQFQQ